MLHRVVAVGLASAVLWGVAAPVSAQDSVVGTFTVEGKTTRFTRVYATLESAPANPQTEYLILLVSDVAIAERDRTPARLLALAWAGSIHALKLRWQYGADDIAVVPYHRDIVESGHSFRSLSTVNLSALDQRRVNAEFKAKMLGQTWFFNALVKAAIVKGGIDDFEPDASDDSRGGTNATAAAGGAAAAGAGGGGVGGSGGDARSAKLALGKMGYEFTPTAFFQAIGDRKADAVKLFLAAGMSANQRDGQNRATLNYAVLFCAQSADEAGAVVRALIDAKADVKTKDPDNGTTALIGAVQSCGADTVSALVKAGSDLNARSNGGMTALQLANIFQRTEVADVLQKAGAK